MDKGKHLIHMNYLKITPTQAKAELKLWQQQGKNLLALVKLQHSKPGFNLLIPGYRCNNWYRLGKHYYPSQQAALAAYGELLDLLAEEISSNAIPPKATA